MTLLLPSASRGARPKNTMPVPWPTWRARSEKKNMNPGQAAAYWNARLSHGADARDEHEFERWRNASPENADAYDRVTSLHDRLRALSDAPEILSLRHETLARLAARQRFQNQMKIGVGVAVAIALVAGLVLALHPAGAAARPPA